MPRWARVCARLFFAWYLLALVAIVLLKNGMALHALPHEPPPWHWRVNLIPLRMVTQYMSRYSAFAVARFNLVGNVVAFVPFGFFLPLLGLRRAGWAHTLLWALAASLCIELLQLIFSLGSADVDDLLLNVLGAALGYALFAAGLHLLAHRLAARAQLH